MFDEEKATGAPPNNLPFAPEQSHAPSNPPTAMPSMSGHDAATPPDALDAGLLKRKNEETGEAMKPTMAMPAESLFSAPVPPPQPLVAMSYATKEPVLGKVLAAVLTVAAIGALGVGGWYGYTRVIKPMLAGRSGVVVTVPTSTQSTTSSGENTVTPTSTYRPQTSSTSLQGETSTETILFGEQIDTDRDGLPDRRERELGIDSTKMDTDTDGLTDGDEVIIWQTDPLNPDSDGDGYKDGQEVQNGYSPLGPGKLFGVTSSSTVSSSVGVTTTPPATTTVTASGTATSTATSTATTPTSSATSSNVPSL